MLNLTHISKSFEVENVGKLKVLEDINLSVKKGEFVCVLGPSGCGETILLYLIAGFLKPTSGEILIEGKPAGNPNTDRIMVFQDYVLFPWKTVYGNVLFGLNETNLNNQQKKELVMKYLGLVGLTKFKDWYIHKLSGGMQQRVAIARALIVNPKILLMDEPFSALDPSYRRHLRYNLEDIWKKTEKTIILVTHDINEALHLADKIYLMTASPATFKKVYRVMFCPD
ncbi:MAG: ABC transporter ATP-binding protein [Nanoarchaeota archaeon]